MKVDVRTPKGWREILRGAIDAYRSQFRAFFLIALATVPVPMLSAVITDRVESDDTATLILFPLQLANTLVFLVVTGAIIHGAHAVTSAVSPLEPGAMLDTALSRFGSIISTQFLFAVLTIASILAFPYGAYRYWQDIQRNEPRGVWTALGVMLGAFLYFSIRWNFAIQSVMLEGRRNWAALDESAELVKGQWWRATGILLVLALSIAPASFVAATAVYLPPLAAAIIGSVALALALPLFTIGQTFLYFDLKVRKQPDVISAD